MLLQEETAQVMRNERYDRKTQVFSFDVYEHRSYFAGGVLVHERCDSGEGDL